MPDNAIHTCGMPGASARNFQNGVRVEWTQLIQPSGIRGNMKCGFFVPPAWYTNFNVFLTLPGQDKILGVVFNIIGTLSKGTEGTTGNILLRTVNVGE